MTNEWTSYEYQRPPLGILCQFERRVYTSQSAEPQITQQFVGYDDFAPLFNIDSLYWRMTGIGRERWDSLSPEVQAQIESPPSGSMGQMAKALMLGGELGLRGLGQSAGPSQSLAHAALSLHTYRNSEFYD